MPLHLYDVAFELEKRDKIERMKEILVSYDDLRESTLFSVAGMGTGSSIWA